MRMIALVAALLASAVIFSNSAQAADPYKWCAEYSGRSGGTNCYFMNFSQCRAAISGNNSGFCRPNPFYTGQRHSRPDDQHFN